MQRGPVVGVFGHYGNRNLGDEAIVAATIQQLRQRLVDVDIVCLSLSPTDTVRRHGVECFSIRYQPGLSNLATPTDVRPPSESQRQSREPPKLPESDDQPAPTDFKEWIKRVPIVAPLARVAARLAENILHLLREIRFIFQSAAYLRKLDLLVIAGSNQFLDNFGGLWGFPYTLLKWSLIAKLVGTKVAYVSVGAGPLEGRLSKLFVRLAQRLADYVSYRDSPSKALVETSWPTVGGLIYPDLAFGLNYSERPTPERYTPHKPVVGINPMPVFDRRYWFEPDDDRYQSYVDKLASFAARLVENDYPVFFFPTMWRDDFVIRDVLERLNSQHSLSVAAGLSFASNPQVADLTAAIQDADIIVATRFHGIVLPFHLRVPVLGIGYFRKTLDLMQQMAQSAYHEDLYTFEVDTLWDKFLSLEENLGEEKRKIAERAAEYQRQVSYQWDTVVKLAINSKAENT